MKEFVTFYAVIALLAILITAISSKESSKPAQYMLYGTALSIVWPVVVVSAAIAILYHTITSVIQAWKK